MCCTICTQASVAFARKQQRKIAGFVLHKQRLYLRQKQFTYKTLVYIIFCSGTKRRHCIRNRFYIRYYKHAASDILFVKPFHQLNGITIRQFEVTNYNIIFIEFCQIFFSHTKPQRLINLCTQS